MSEHVTAGECSDGVLLIRLSDPPTKNAIDRDACDGIAACVRSRGAGGVVVLTGVGRVFSSGAKLGPGTAPPSDVADAFCGVLREVGDAGCVTIAALNGPAIGLGALLALACDLRVASCDAYFEVPVVRLGLHLDERLFTWLHENVGDRLTRSLLLGNQRIHVKEAHGLGLVNEVHEAPVAASITWAERIAAFPASSVAHHKRLSTLARNRQ